MNNETTRPHSVFIQDRSRAELTGIREVESFNETGIELLSHDGAVAIEGEMLKIDQFSVETGKIWPMKRDFFSTYSATPGP